MSDAATLGAVPLAVVAEGASWVEVRRLQSPGRRKQPGDLGGHSFQRWLGEAPGRAAAAGCRVRLFVAVPRSDHVVAAFYPVEVGQLAIPVEAVGS